MHNTKSILADLQAGRLSRSAALGLLQSAAHPDVAPAVPPVAAAGLAAPGGGPIAIIGAAGCYPQAADLDQFWQNLAEGRDCVAPVPAARWDVDAYFDKNRATPGTVYCRDLGALDEVDRFDPLMFQISPAEAEYMDPQHRLFLEQAYRSFEDAGYSPARLAGANCGVYLGIMSNEYAGMLLQSGVPLIHATGNAASIAAARIAYLLNLKGPALAIDTACSSSLVALHLACQALRSGEIDLALGGGVSVYLGPDAYVAMCGAGMLSQAGRCKAFANDADGFVPGEGVGAVVLKRLADAERDGDRVLATIVGSGINQDGRTNGMTAPSGASQVTLLRTVYRQYGIDPASIGYCELHGTGTKLGDPVELNAIAQVFSAVASQSCPLGSVKSNIGHTSAAAGVAGLHKIMLSLRHRRLVPSLHFGHPNEHFDFSHSPFQVNTEFRDWPAKHAAPRRAALSSFGLSGTNAHMVIQEYVDARPAGDASAPGLIVLSARTAGSLAGYAQALRRHVDSDTALCLADLAYTLQTGRAELPHRLAIACRSPRALLAALDAVAAGQEHAGVWQGVAGQGAGSGVDEGAAEDFAAHRWDALASAWVDGVQCDWQALHRSAGWQVRTVAAPTYPFAREHYWIPGQPTPSSRRQAVFLQPGWTSAPLTGQRGAGADGAVLVLFDGQCARGAALARALEKYLPQVIPVAAEEWPDAPDWPDLQGVIDLTDGSLARSAWLACMQQLVRTLIARTGSVLIGVTHDGAPGPAALQGAMYRTLQCEYPRLRARHVDLGAGLEAETEAMLVAAEYTADTDALACRYRDGARQCALLALWPAAASSAARAFDVRDVVWISGGTRGLGLLFGVHLARRYGVRKMVLSGKNSLPPRAAWDSLASTDAAFALRLAGVQALEALGVQLVFSSVPLADAAAVRVEHARVVALLGPVTGLLHCAGVSDWSEPALIAKTPAALAAVLTPKTDGLTHLSAALAGGPLRSLVLFSSVAAGVPALGAGQIDYAMANVGLDTFARDYAGPGWCVSIQWPSWQGTGMGAVRSQVYRDSGLLGLSDAEGLALFDEILDRRLGPVVLPAVVDASSWMPHHLAHDRPHWQHAARVAPVVAVMVAAAGAAVTAPGSADAAPTQAAAEGWLCTLFARELKLDLAVLRADTAFHEYGIDSIMLTQIMRPLNRWAETTLDPSLLFEHGSIARLAAWLGVHQPGLLVRALSGQNFQPAAAPAPDVALPAPDNAPGPIAIPGNDIAVVGLACRFPGAHSPAAFWRLLETGGSGIGPVPSTRWGHDSPYFAGLIQPGPHFDAHSFGIPETDARAMDPQALLLLELGQELLQDAGYAPLEVKGGQVGVFLGGRSQHQAAPELLAQARYPVVATGQNYLAANLSHHFDLRGPSLVIDTACSSALMAMQTAIQSLRAGELDAAIVGGVSLLPSDAGHRMFSQRGLLAPGAAFHMFDARAGGVVLGEGAGLALLKPLAAAQAAGDRIYAVIKGIAANNDGRTAGPASPSFDAQKSVQATALARSGLLAQDVVHVEANGSGTLMTDLLELKAIDAVYGTARPEPCGIGAVKANLGHVLCAQGMAAFIKVALMLHHRRSVPFLSGEMAMPHYPLDRSRFAFARGSAALTGTLPAAAINSFADGGTNVHVVLQAYPPGHAPRRTALQAPQRQPEPRPAPATGAVWKRTAVRKTAQA